MRRFNNKKKESFLSTIPEADLESDADKLTLRCKFNFHYLDVSQSAGQSFGSWDKNKLKKFFDKLKNYSEESLSYWENMRIGKGKNHVLEVYKKFPDKSKFSHPKFVPHQVHWARFRLEYDDRLIGFVIPSEYKDKPHSKANYLYDCNTFYVVFLDENHNFYQTK